MLRLERRPEPELTGEWECMECGYIEAGVKARRPRECPECGAPANALEFFASEESDGDWDSGDVGGADFDAETEEEDLF